MAKKRSRAAASSSSRSASARSNTSGFSTSSGQPASITRSVVSKWSSLGRHSDTRSGGSSSSISSRSTYGRGVELACTCARSCRSTVRRSRTARRRRVGRTLGRARAPTTRRSRRPRHAAARVTIAPSVRRRSARSRRRRGTVRSRPAGGTTASVPTWLIRFWMTPSSRTPISVPGQATGTSAEQGSADHDGRDGLQLESAADRREARRRSGGDEHPGQPAQHTGHRVQRRS